MNDSIEFDALVGEHMLDAVDFATEKIQSYGDRFEDAQCMRFRLDGVVYCAIENPDDGYRSCLDKIIMALTSLMHSRQLKCWCASMISLNMARNRIFFSCLVVRMGS